MAQRKTTTTTKIATILLVALIAFVAWSIAGTHVVEPRGTVSTKEAEKFARITLPASAANVRMAGYQQWIQYEQFIRAEAPVADCLTAAAAMVPGETLRPADAMDLQMLIQPVRKGVFRDFSWFDLRSATNVLTAGGGPSQPQVWVDQDRGVLYFSKTD